MIATVLDFEILIVSRLSEHQGDAAPLVVLRCDVNLQTSIRIKEDNLGRLSLVPLRKEKLALR